MKKNLKFMGIIVAFAMIIQLFTVGLSAEGVIENSYNETTVAVIEGYVFDEVDGWVSGDGTAEFSNLQDALDAASKLEGCKVQLVQDVQGNFEINGGKFTLSLGKYVIDGTENYARDAQPHYVLSINDADVSFTGYILNKTGSGIYCENSTVSICAAIHDFNGDGEEAYGINSKNSDITVSGSAILTENSVTTYGINAEGGSLNITGSAIGLTSDFPITDLNTEKFFYGVKADDCALTINNNSRVSISTKGYGLDENASVEYPHYAIYISGGKNADLKDLTAIVVTGTEGDGGLVFDSEGNPIYNTVSGQQLTMGWNYEAKAIYNDGSNLTATNCTFTAQTNGEDADANAVVNTGAGVVTLNNCTLSAKATGISHGSEVNAIYNSNGSIEVNGGSIDASAVSDYANGIGCYGDTTAQNNVTLNGGTINVFSKTKNAVGVMLENGKSNLTVDGCELTVKNENEGYPVTGIYCKVDGSAVDFVSGKITTTSPKGWDAAFVCQDDNKLNIQGGVINANMGFIDEGGKTKVTMTGGEINAKDMTFQQRGNTEIQISAGTFPLGFRGADGNFATVPMTKVASDWLVSPKVFLDEQDKLIPITDGMMLIDEYTYVGDAYKVTVNVKGKGNATADLTDLTKVTEGEKVTITCEAEKGSHFVSIKADDKEIVLTKTASGKYEFTMPAKDVVITVTFAYNAPTGGGGNGGGNGNVDVEIPTDGNKPDPDDITVVDKDGGNKYPDIEVDDDGTIIIPDLEPGDKVIIEDDDGNKHIVIVPDDNSDKDHNKNLGDVETDKVHLSKGKNEVINPQTFDDTPILAIYGLMITAFAAGLYLIVVFKKRAFGK